jgi:hypothetical protein
MSCDFEEMFGEIVGKGLQATVYAKGEHAVKLYREGYPKTYVFSEAFIMANLEPLNFPGPRIYEVLLVDGRYGLRMDRAKGKLMLEELESRDPARWKATLDALVNLQCRLQKNKVGGAPDLKQRFHDDLVNKDWLSADLKKNLLEILDGLPDGQALCHCDFHAGNVFLTARSTRLSICSRSAGAIRRRMPLARMRRTVCSLAIRNAPNTI